MNAVRLFSFLVALGLWSWAALPVQAQPIAVEDEEEAGERLEPLKAYEPEAAPVEAAPVEAAPVEKPAVPAAGAKPAGAARVLEPARNIQHVKEAKEAIAERWRKRGELLGARDAKRAEEQLVEIEKLRVVFGFSNVFSVSSLLVSEADALRLEGRGAEALERCRWAEKLSPSFAPAYVCRVRALIDSQPTALGEIFDALRGALVARSEDVRSRHVWFVDEVMKVFFALVSACLLLSLLLVFRHARLFVHDFHHLFPRGVPRWQSLMVALVLVALPALVGFGLLGSLAVAAIGASFFLSRKESVALVLALASLGAILLGATKVVESASVSLAAQDIHLLERGEGSAAAVARLGMLAEQRSDATAALALARYEKRLGHYEVAAGWYEKALAFGAPAAIAKNNLGNVRFLQGDSAQAVELYREANLAAPKLAEPLYNLAKMYFREGRLAEGEQAQQAALALGGERVSERIGVQDDTRANLFVFDLALSDEALLRAARSGSKSLQGVDVNLLEPVVGSNGSRTAALVAFAAAFAVLCGSLLQRRVRAASRCEKCGRPVCGRCDPDLGSSSGLCGQCISVFVRRTGVDPPDRIRKEIQVRGYRHRHRLMVRGIGVLLPGAGHLISGRVLAGALIVVASSCLLTQVLLRDGALPSPILVDGALSPLRFTLFALVFALVHVLGVWHLVRGEEGD